MLGIKGYMIHRSNIEDFSLTISNISDNSLIFRYRAFGGGSIWPSLFCFGYCKEGTGRNPRSTCSKCPYLSITCSNMSYSLTCISGYYPQPTTIGIQKCFYCMAACKVCKNYSYCIECQPTNLLTSNNSCEKCSVGSEFAGDICSKIPGCSTAESVNGKSVCRFCSITEHFLMIPINEKCQCQSKYILKDGKCVDRCGDGILISHKCDDNNTENHDGCSSQCVE